MQKRKITLKRWILKTVLVGLLAMAAIVLIVPWYIGSKMRNQAREANEKLAAVYLEFLDTNVEGLNKLLSQFAANTYDISILAISEDKMQRYFSEQNVMQKLEDASMIYNVFDGIFVYSDSKIDQKFLCQVGSGGNGRQVGQMKEIVRDFEKNYSVNTWELVQYEDQEYMMRVVKTGSTYCGAWIETSSLIRPFKNIQFDEMGTALFLDREGKVLHGAVGMCADMERLSEENNGRIVRLDGAKYLQIAQSSRVMPVSMVILMPEEVYLGDIYTIQNVIGLLLGISLLIFPVLWRLLSRNVSRPVDQLTQAMEEVQKGKLEVRIKPEGKFLEFEETGRYFNGMVSEIERLKRDVYERTISEQKTELQYLQTQIRPHFFLNALNVIYSFSLVKRNDLIEKMVVCLSKYFSYRFQSTDSFTRFGYEIEHIENYLELQRLRYHNEFESQIEVEEVLLDAKLPPLVIQTFVENSLKYGISKDKAFELEITAEPLTVGKEQKLQITIIDNGPGYEQEVLDAVGKRQQIRHSHGQGIGINNVIQRLRLLYQEEAWVQISNMEGGGACSVIVIPLEFAEEDEEEEAAEGEPVEEGTKEEPAEGKHEHDFTCG